MNLPNKLTLSRILLTGIFIYLLFLNRTGSRAAALVVFLIAALTDYWDGRLARERNQITPFGQLMDPIADKFLTLSAFISFVQLGILPAWMVIVITLRELLVTSLRFSISQAQQKKTEARQSGKHKTVLQITAITGILVFLTLKEFNFWSPGWTPRALSIIHGSMLLIVVVTVWSGVRYIVKNKGSFGQ